VAESCWYSQDSTKKVAVYGLEPITGMRLLPVEVQQSIPVGL